MNMRENFKDITEKEYSDLILKRISMLMNKRNLKQLDLSEKSNIGQSSLSKIMNGEMKMTLHHIFKICKALGVAPCDLFATGTDIETISNFNEFSENVDLGVINEKYINDQILIRDTKHLAFKGYVNNEFHFYCYPTISSESSLLEGIISFRESKNYNYCEAELVLYTGQISSTKEKIKKIYHGELIISLSMGTCYAILINPEIGEILTIGFTHTFLFNQELICRVCTVNSTSSGGNKLPVMQRALISKNKLCVDESNSSDLEFVRGQLKLNESAIIISNEIFEDLLENGNPKLREFFKKCKNCFQDKNFLVGDESSIRAIVDASDIKAQGISALRNGSITPKYNKISTKTEEFVFQYIEKKK